MEQTVLRFWAYTLCLACGALCRQTGSGSTSSPLPGATIYLIEGGRKEKEADILLFATSPAPHTHLIHTRLPLPACPCPLSLPLPCLYFPLWEAGQKRHLPLHHLLPLYTYLMHTNVGGKGWRAPAGRRAGRRRRGRQGTASRHTSLSLTTTSSLFRGFGLRQSVEGAAHCSTLMAARSHASHLSTLHVHTHCTSRCFTLFRFLCMPLFAFALHHAHHAALTPLIVNLFYIITGRGGGLFCASIISLFPLSALQRTLASTPAGHSCTPALLIASHCSSRMYSLIYPLATLLSARLLALPGRTWARRRCRASFSCLFFLMPVALNILPRLFLQEGLRTAARASPSSSALHASSSPLCLPGCFLILRRQGHLFALPLLPALPACLTIFLFWHASWAGRKEGLGRQKKGWAAGRRRALFHACLFASLLGRKRKKAARGTLPGGQAGGRGRLMPILPLLPAPSFLSRTHCPRPLPLTPHLSSCLSFPSFSSAHMSWRRKTSLFLYLCLSWAHFCVFTASAAHLAHHLLSAHLPCTSALSSFANLLRPHPLPVRNLFTSPHTMPAHAPSSFMPACCGCTLTSSFLHTTSSSCLHLLTSCVPHALCWKKRRRRRRI